MPKQFYTANDIVDMFKGGVMSLEVNDQVVLTEMAYEKARSVGMKLVRDKPENPPSAPVRPYLSQRQVQRPVAPAAAPVIASHSPSSVLEAGVHEDISLQQRIRDAVIARLGSQVNPSLLDVLIQRVLKTTGVK